MEYKKLCIFSSSTGIPLTMNSSSNSNISAEVAREFRRMCEVAGIDVDEFFRILHLVIRQLEEGVLATSNTNATTGQPPSAPAPPPSLLITSTASSALRRANPIARSIRRVHFRAPLECGTGPVRRNGNNRFFCIIVGRHVGVFPGPMYVFSFLFKVSN